MSSGRLALAFLAAIAPADRPRFAALDDLEETLEDLVATAEIQWPPFSVPAERFVADIARCASARAEFSAVDALSSLRTDDLYLASACASADPAALACFESSVLSQLPPALRRIGLNASAVDEVIQRLRAALLVAAPDRPPGIASYSGRGKLYSFVRSAAVRQAIKLSGSRDRAAAGDSDLEAIAAPVDDPEMLHFKQLYSDEFRTAFTQALGDLTPMERNLLRQHHIDCLSVTELGALYQVHRATAARWVASARSKLFAGTRDRLMERLGLGETGVASIIRLVHSQLDLSLVRQLGPGE